MSAGIYLGVRNTEQKNKLWLEFETVYDGFEGDWDVRLKPAPIKTFHQFPNLPTELRLKIWQATIQPRVVVVTCVDAKTKDAKRAETELRPRRSRVPRIFHICHESRHVAQKHYELAFAWKVPPRLACAETSIQPGGDDARVYFNFSKDALFFLGELEPYDLYGFNSPMVYFLRKEDTSRVRHIACAFEELQLSLFEADSIFNTLFHIIDRFPLAKQLLITTTPRDAETRLQTLPTADNVIQKIWNAFMNGTTTINATLAHKQILMINEHDLGDFIGKDFEYF